MNSFLQADGDSGGDLDRLYKKVSLRLMPPLLLAYVVAYLDRVNVGFAKLQMLKDLGFSETVYGLGAGIFFIGYFLLGVPSNLMLHRIGARRWVALLMVSWGVISACMCTVSSIRGFYILRFLLGVAEAGFFPGVIFFLTQWYPPTRRSRANALFMLAVPICGALGSIASGAILQSLDQARGWAGWQWLFVLEAAPAVLVGIYIAFRLDDDVAAVPWLRADERAAIAASLAAPADAALNSIGAALRDRRVWLGCLVYFCAVCGIYGVSFWLPSIIVDLGFHQPLTVGMLSAIPYAAAGVGMVWVGQSADRRDEHRWHLIGAALVGAAGLFLSGLLSAHVLAAFSMLVLATFGTLTMAPLFWSLTSRYLRGVGAATGIGFINSFGCLAGFVSPYAIGWIRQSTGSTKLGLYAIAVIVAVGALLVTFLPARRAAPGAPALASQPR